MPFPLIPLALASMAVSAGANLYSQKNSRALYRRQYNAYKSLETGYDDYLRLHGRRSNPHRMYVKYGAHSDSAGTNVANSYANSFGTGAGTFGAGTMLTKRWL